MVEREGRTFAIMATLLANALFLFQNSETLQWESASKLVLVNESLESFRKHKAARDSPILFVLQSIENSTALLTL